MPFDQFYLAAVFGTTGILPGVLYTKYGVVGLAIGTIIGLVVQYISLGLFMKYIQKDGKGPISDYLNVVDVVLIGVVSSSFTLAYAMYKEHKSTEGLLLGLVLGAAIGLAMESLSVKLADSTFGSK